jgi:hypothetical protein
VWRRRRSRRRRRRRRSRRRRAVCVADPNMLVQLCAFGHYVAF